LLEQRTGLLALLTQVARELVETLQEGAHR
jgi:hypothetical protein